MDDEKNEVELPASGESSEEPQSDDVAQGDSSSGVSSEEGDIAGPPGDPEESESGEDVPGSPEEEISADNGEAPADEDSAPEDNEVAESGGGSLLSQDEIDSVLGNMGGQTDETTSGSSMPDMGSLETDEAEIKQADFQQLSASSDESEPRNIDLLMDVDLPVSIELGRTKMRISDILVLGPGSIVELDKLVGEPVDLLVNQKCVARGEVVVVEESFGLRITHLVSPEERLKNLQ